MNLFQRIYVNVSGNIRYIILKKKKFKNHRKIMWEQINIEIRVHQEYFECAMQVTLKLEVYHFNPIFWGKSVVFQETPVTSVEVL